MIIPTQPLRVLALILAIGLMPALARAQAGSASGDGIQPVVVTGNPDCQDLGPYFGFKPFPEPPPVGTYFFGSATTTPPHAPTSDALTITNVTPSGTYNHFDWVSTLGIDAVIVKGGANANVYNYTPEDFGDTSLHPPVNSGTGEPFSVSHIEFCYDFELGVNKTAETSFTRTWSWTIDKTASVTDLVLSPGQQFAVDYSVAVEAAPTLSDFAASGEVWIDNLTPLDATVESVTDVISGPVAAAVNCGPLPHVLTPGQSLHCTYSTPLPDDADRVNTATVTTSGIVGGGEATADVIFGAPSVEIDECVDVTDTMFGVLGTVCNDAVPASFHYEVNVGPFQDPDDCGQNFVVNTGTLVTDDTSTTLEDTWTIGVDVPCDGGCTLSQGYWKTHSQYGPAPYDNAWSNVGPDEGDTPFLGSGQTYYQVLWTVPKGGNAWYILAHQYIAAKLNELDGAWVPDDVSAALAFAEVLLMEYDADGPQTNGKNRIPMKSADRAAANSLYLVLDDYNNGLVGPGECSENDTPARPDLGSSGERAAMQAPASDAFQADAPVPTEFRITSYPNPFNAATTLRIEVPEPVHVRLDVYDVLGRRVSRLADDRREAGVHAVTWNAGDLPSGTYIYVFRAGTFRQTGSIVLMK